MNCQKWIELNIYWKLWQVWTCKSQLGEMAFTWRPIRLQRKKGWTCQNCWFVLGLRVSNEKEGQWSCLNPWAMPVMSIKLSGKVKIFQGQSRVSFYTWVWFYSMSLITYFPTQSWGILPRIFFFYQYTERN